MPGSLRGLRAGLLDALALVPSVLILGMLFGASMAPLMLPSVAVGLAVLALVNVLRS